MARMILDMAPFRGELVTGNRSSMICWWRTAGILTLNSAVVNKDAEEISLSGSSSATFRNDNINSASNLNCVRTSCAVVVFDIVTPKQRF